MARKTFRGGVHPKEGKHYSAHKPIESLPLSEQVIIPLQQHIGAPAEPVVAKGDTVTVGQVIGRADKFVSIPIHSSVSGTVKAVESHPHPLGARLMAVVIENDPEAEQNMKPTEDSGYLDLPAETMKKRVLEAGIAGQGGAAFPTHVKLSPPPDKKIDLLIINGVECEPFLTADHQLMLEAPDEILSGIRCLQTILNVKKVVIGIEANKADAIQIFTKKTAKNTNIQVFSLPVKYPQGGEKQLINAVTGREVPAGGLPMDIGCVVQNVGTAFSVYEAVRYQKPLIERVVTVTGPGIRVPKNLRVRIGTPFQTLVDYCGGLTENAGKIISGGPMMGMAQFSLAVPVIKGTSGILILEDDMANQCEETPCISCARCVDICPMQLLPNQLATMVEYDKIDPAKSYGLFDCMECGSCAYICPAKRRLVHYIKLGKAVWAEQQKRAS